MFKLMDKRKAHFYAENVSLFRHWFSFYFYCINFSVIDKLRPDADSDVATTSLRVSLMCPVSEHLHPPVSNFNPLPASGDFCHLLIIFAYDTV